jgi:hypothetical protein
MNVGLVSCVKDDGVPWRLEHPVNRNCRFNYAEVGAKVTTSLRDRSDEIVTNFRAQILELLKIQVVEIPRTIYFV